MKVDSLAIESNKGRIKDLDRKQKTYIANREKELKNIKQHYEKKIADSKESNLKQLYDVQDHGKDQLVQTTKSFQKNADALKSQQNSLKQRLANEKESLELRQKNQLDNVLASYHEAISSAREIASNKASELSADLNEQMKNLESDRNINLLRLKNKNTDYLNNAEFDQKQKINKIQDNMTKELLAKKVKHKLAIIEQNTSHNKKVADATNEQTRELNQRQAIHDYNLKDQQQKQKEHLSATQRAFDEKYKNLVIEQQNALKLLDDRLQSERDRIISAHSTKLALEKEIITDPFYQVKKIEPTVSEAEDAYILTIPSPEHEKDKFNLSANQRMVRLSLARRFKSRFNETDGTVFKGHRTESFSKEFQLSDIVDPKSISKKWENGVLTFKIKKA